MFMYFGFVLLITNAEAERKRFAGESYATLLAADLTNLPRAHPHQTNLRPNFLQKNKIPPRVAQQREMAGQWTGRPKRIVEDVSEKKIVKKKKPNRPPQRMCTPFNLSKKMGSPGSRSWFSEGCIGKDDVISWVPIAKGKGVCLEGQCYNIDSLKMLFQLSPVSTVPHSRREFTLEQFEILAYGKTKRITEAALRTLSIIQRSWSLDEVNMVWSKAGTTSSALDVVKNMNHAAGLTSDAIALIYDRSGRRSGNEILKHISAYIGYRSIEKVYHYNEGSLNSANDVLKSIKVDMGPEHVDLIYERSQSIHMANDIIANAGQHFLLGSVKLIFDNAGSEKEAADVLKHMKVRLDENATAMIYKMADRPVDANYLLKHMKAALSADAIECIYAKVGTTTSATEIIKSIQPHYGLQKDVIEKIYDLFDTKNASFILKHMQAYLSPEAIAMIYRKADLDARDILIRMRSGLKADQIELIYQKAGTQHANAILRQMGKDVEWSLPKIELIYGKASSLESANEIMKHMRMTEFFWDEEVEFIFNRSGVSAEDVFKSMKIAVELDVIKIIYNRAGGIYAANEVLKNIHVHLDEEEVTAIYDLAGSASAANDILKNMHAFVYETAIKLIYGLAGSKEDANDILKQIHVGLGHSAISAIYSLADSKKVANDILKQMQFPLNEQAILAIASLAHA
jgi:hypothetical protein